MTAGFLQRTTNKMEAQSFIKSCLLEMQLCDMVLKLPGPRLRSALLQAGCWTG